MESNLFKMKNWITISASVAGAIVFYYIAFPITAIIIASVTIMLPAKLVGLAIFTPFVIYFICFFLIFKIKLWYSRLPPDKG